MNIINIEHDMILMQLHSEKHDDFQCLLLAHSETQNKKCNLCRLIGALVLSNEKNYSMTISQLINTIWGRETYSYRIHCCHLYRQSDLIQHDLRMSVVGQTFCNVKKNQKKIGKTESQIYRVGQVKWLTTNSHCGVQSSVLYWVIHQEWTGKLTITSHSFIHLLLLQ